MKRPRNLMGIALKIFSLALGTCLLALIMTMLLTACLGPASQAMLAERDAQAADMAAMLQEARDALSLAQVAGTSTADLEALQAQVATLTAQLAAYDVETEQLEVGERAESAEKWLSLASLIPNVGGPIAGVAEALGLAQLIALLASKRARQNLFGKLAAGLADGDWKTALSAIPSSLGWTHTNKDASSLLRAAGVVIKKTGTGDPQSVRAMLADLQKRLNGAGKNTPL